MPFHEFDYEQPGAVVLGRQDGWYHVQLRDGSGWIAPGRAGEFHGYAVLVANSLSYLEARWDGRLWSAPNRSADAQFMSYVWRNHMDAVLPIEILETVLQDDGIWFRLALVWPHLCNGDEPKTIATGWVPGYVPDGAPNLWFHSRGC